MDRKRIQAKLFFWYSCLWIFLCIALYLSYGVYFVNTTSTKSQWVGLFSGSIAILLASCKICEILFVNHNNKIIKQIVSYFYNGSKYFLRKQNKFLFFVAIIISFLIYHFFDKQIWLIYLICFIFGIVAVEFCTKIINFTVIRTSTRISYSPGGETLSEKFKLAFNSGIVIAMASVGLALVGTAILYYSCKDYQILTAFALGGSIVAIYNSTCALISKKSCENANQIVSNLYEDFEYDDKRNPLLLLKGISSFVFPSIIFSNDMFVSFVIVLFSAMCVGGECLNLMGAFLPIIITASGVFVSIIVTLLTRFSKGNNPTKKMFLSLFAGIILFSFISYFIVKTWLPENIRILYPIIAGAGFGYLSCLANIKNVFQKYKAVKSVSNATNTGIFSVIIHSLKEGFGTSFVPMFLIACAVIASFLLCYGTEAPLLGVYGITLMALGLLSSTGIIVAIYNFALVSNNVKDVAKTYEGNYNSISEDKIYALKQFGFEIQSLVKNFINTTSIIGAMSAIIAYSVLIGLEEIDILNPYVMGSLFIGCVVPVLYCAYIFGGVSKSTGKLIFEVKKQFRKFPQIINYEMRPDYENCIKVAAKNSSVQATFYVLVIIAIFFILTYNLHTEALAGFVVGAILSTALLIYVSSNTAIITKSAKKYLKNERNYSKFSEEYSSISLTDSIYCTISDLIVPSLNNLIKTISILALSLSILFVNI